MCSESKSLQAIICLLPMPLVWYDAYYLCICIYVSMLFQVSLFVHMYTTECQSLLATDPRKMKLTVAAMTNQLYIWFLNVILHTICLCNTPNGHSTWINKICLDAKLSCVSTSTKLGICFSDDGHPEARQPEEHPVRGDRSGSVCPI